MDVARSLPVWFTDLLRTTPTSGLVINHVPQAVKLEMAAVQQSLFEFLPRPLHTGRYGYES
jgi:hypothetical protein